MTRKWMLKVHDHKALVSGRSYRVRVNEIKKPVRINYFTIKLEHMSKQYKGRVDTITLPLPVRPDGLAAQFFASCGFNVAVDTELTPQDAVGRHLCAILNMDSEGKIQAVTFKPCSRGDSE